ncbi:hypothetical protein AGABI2DRAFT_207264 [Agaricus bisporus var. bisporus H97]|uniref:hypothetical protein n=1 Tax=Agaricus bisporus var. bisporus (strain H97 / ATCC MYA-4626 / FGSC 10389) TaxID=936046 RepID=UPI00029F6183|nr:hypothetical protein AGABI2DRAFT_207264 [Agaricus bisporus var. bisporus H97]EKV45887.1 hypothetical protein AGABI2DRAFT_207264 [Agaricus bisporus var. bisporus H97]
MNVVASPTTSHTGLLERSSHLKSTSTLEQLQEANLSRKSKGKSKKRVHYKEDNRDSVILPPASPTEVLSRTSQTVEANTSAAANVPFVPCPPVKDPADGDVILRDRMLVKISSTKAHNLSAVFHESIHRTTRDLEYEDWGEFMVAWRKDLIEIYEDYNTPMQEWAAGHKRLAYVIPLKSDKTHLSLYSFVDMTFCITCQPMCTSFTKQTKWNFTKLDGTCVYIFNNKSRSRAYDWVWQLWYLERRYMGGEIPRSVDIQNPHLGSQVAFELPNLNLMDQKTAIRMFSRRNIIALCIKSMKPIPGWSNFIEHERKKGRKLQLAWRFETHVDWVWNDETCEDKQREWTVLSGLALKNSPRAPVLELRVAEHFPTSLYLKDGTLLVQPPDIEGYVNRIRANTQSKQLLYLATHDGHLFTISPQQAQPPSPPGSALLLDSIEEYKQRLTKVEFERGIYQIMHAHAVFDLRNVVAVRRAFQIPHLRMKRSFELLLNNGRVQRFEVHSRRVAIEWVERLHALAEYWKHRNRANAKEEIDLGQATHPRVTPQIRVYDEDEAPLENPDPSAHYPALDRLFNWCVIDGCRSITKAGKLYMRKGLRGQFKLVQMYLVNGHLIPFLIASGFALHVAMRKRINLVDAYVCSGYMAALTLPKGQYCPNAPIAARRYEDGLEANDREEDMLIVIRYRKHAPEIPQRPGIVLVPNSKANNNTSGSQWIPPLSEKYRFLILRTRSKIERDAWCWALNIEIEKLTRKQKGREEKLRQTGNLRKLD